MSNFDLNDGIHGMLPVEKMDRSAKRLRDTYAGKPDAPIFMREFGYYSLEKWKKEGHFGNVKDDNELNIRMKEIFKFDEPGNYLMFNLGWCEPAFSPYFEEKLIEDRGVHEVVRDIAGRHVLYFKGRRHGFMPEYIDHPVKDMKSWEENCKWRLDPNTAERYSNLENEMNAAKEQAGKGIIMSQGVMGGYMFLRSMIGPLELLYKFYDEPELIHDCMQTWLKLADAVTAKHQKHITIDEVYIAEDICYNHGTLISPDMMKEFLFPYYQQLITNIKSRQLDKNRHLYFQVDTDGYCVPAIPLFQSLGMDIMNPFEVASGCDVVKIGKQFPQLKIFGGIDKRILAESKEAIDRHIDYIVPEMRKRGGYIPTCDHGVPEEVSFENYMHFRKRLLEFAE